MEQSILERFLYWFCDTFGHAKSSKKNAEWEHNNHVHYTCTRCRRTVSKPINELVKKGRDETSDIWKFFDVAYKKACSTSQPKDWMDAALFAQQVKNVLLKASPTTDSVTLSKAEYDALVKDKERLDYVNNNCLILEPVSYDDDDAGYHWVIKQWHMGEKEPRTLCKSYSEDVRQAVDQDMNNSL